MRNTNSKSAGMAQSAPRNLMFLAVATLLAASANAQQRLLTTALPNAPSALLQEATPVQKDPAGMTGTVSDIHGGLVPGAEIKLVEKGQADSPNAQQTRSDSEGNFRLTNIVPGSYSVIISSPGLETFESPTITLKPGERFELPDIALPIASATTTVDVVMTQSQIADSELKLETKQRVLGIVPNFYTSYLWNAAPLNTSQKFKLSARSITDPFIFVNVAIVAGIEQSRDTFPEYGSGPSGFGKRYGAAYGDATIGRVLGAAIYPSLFHQDPRYFFMGPNQRTSARLKHALLAGLVARGDNGHWQPNFSHIAGNASAGAISTLYHSRDHSAGELAGINAAVGIGGGALQGLFREFLWPHITTKIPSYARGKPASHQP
jgi:hypothetical protein